MNQQESLAAILGNLHQQLAIKANEYARQAADLEKLQTDFNEYKAYQLERDQDLIEKIEQSLQKLTSKVETTVDSNTRRVAALEMKLAIMQAWVAGLVASWPIILTSLGLLAPLWVGNLIRSSVDQHVDKYHQQR